MGRELLFFIPFSYAAHSRFVAKRDYIFHFLYEWFPAVVILAYALQGDMLKAIYSFALGYTAFIALYEIGYLVNDFYSVKHETDGRNRAGKLAPDKTMLTAWVIWRLVLAISLIYVIGPGNYLYFFTAIALLIVFGTHNLLRSKKLKIGTFILLATLRFYLPFLPFLSLELLLKLLPGIFLCYVCYRTITYAQSKGLWMKVPKTNKFRIVYYGMISLISGIVYLTDPNAFLLLFPVYYLFIWIGFSLASLFSNTSIR